MYVLWVKRTSKLACKIWISVIYLKTEFLFYTRFGLPVSLNFTKIWSIWDVQPFKATLTVYFHFLPTFSVQYRSVYGTGDEYFEESRCNVRAQFINYIICDYAKHDDESEIVFRYTRRMLSEVGDVICTAWRRPTTLLGESQEQFLMSRRERERQWYAQASYYRRCLSWYAK